MNRNEGKAINKVLEAFFEVALIDAKACAAQGQMSVSWWLDKVRDGSAPKPVVQQPRCTRWRVAEVYQFWSNFALAGDPEATIAMRAKLVKASEKARVARASGGLKARRAAKVSPQTGATAEREAPLSREAQ